MNGQPQIDLCVLVSLYEAKKQLQQSFFFSLKLKNHFNLKGK